jgi:hypothetical protein
MKIAHPHHPPASVSQCTASPFISNPWKAIVLARTCTSVWYQRIQGVSVGQAVSPANPGPGGVRAAIHFRIVYFSQKPEALAARVCKSWIFRVF